MTVVKGDSLKGLEKITASLIRLFERAPADIILIGDYAQTVEDIIDGREVLSEGWYEEIKTEKNSDGKTV